MHFGWRRPLSSGVFPTGHGAFFSLPSDWIGTGDGRGFLGSRLLQIMELASGSVHGQIHGDALHDSRRENHQQSNVNVLWTDCVERPGESAGWLIDRLIEITIIIFSASSFLFHWCSYLGLKPFFVNPPPYHHHAHLMIFYIVFRPPRFHPNELLLGQFSHVLNLFHYHFHVLTYIHSFIHLIFIHSFIFQSAAEIVDVESVDPPAVAAYDLSKARSAMKECESGLPMVRHQEINDDDWEEKVNRSGTVCRGWYQL